MKKPLILFLIIGLAILVMANSAQATSLSFSPASQEVALGSPVTVDLMISGLGNGTAPSLGTFDLDVSFDPAILSLNGVFFGDPTLGDQLDLTGFGLLLPPVSTPGVGSVNLFELSLDSAQDIDLLQNSSFILASLTFGSIGVGITDLGITINNLGDSMGESLTADVDSGSVTVAGAPIPEPATVLLLAAGLGGLGFVRRRRILGI